MNVQKWATIDPAAGRISRRSHRSWFRSSPAPI
eukprot:CAMPEP_0117687996 /NCGR_PEP_ID=MMETSP0804-20121206/23521_1 /TAXON_ID=1074897 /ORGANISM="Tetraselmis astigmatica, Strain CCMP880" /LENGTH=32 /DNA_ID= /DNA_START= /DNA_END= /DNA_ORIENTATION=